MVVLLEHHELRSESLGLTRDGYTRNKLSADRIANFMFFCIPENSFLHDFGPWLCT